MSQDETQPRSEPVEQRSISGDAALIAGAALAGQIAQPIVSAWAQQQFGKPADTPTPPASEPPAGE